MAPMWESLSFRVLTGPPSASWAERTVLGMDTRNEIHDFLTTRRARITPEQAGLPAYGGNRRVTGLRREEVALLAGVSVDYYTRLERGNARGVSESVLEALARRCSLMRPSARTCSTLPARQGPRHGRPRREAGPPERAAHPRLDDHYAGVPAQRAHGHPR
jgi:transcriptional regulator with XRE-family HTH domain